MRRPLSLGGEGPPCILSVNYVMKIYYKFLWKSIKGGQGLFGFVVLSIVF